MNTAPRTITPALQAGYDAQVRTTTITRGDVRLGWNMTWDHALRYGRQLATSGPVTLTQPEHGPFPARTTTIR